MPNSIKFTVAGFALAIASVSHAQSWPTKPIVFLNPFPAG